MPAVDLFLLLVLLLSVLLGFWRGLVREMFSLAGWVAAFVLAQSFAGWTAARLPLQDFAEPLRHALGFATVFIVVAFGAGWLSALIGQAVDSVGLRSVDRVLGAGFGLLRGLVMLLALALVVNMTPLKQQEGWQASAGARHLEQGLQLLRNAAPASLARYFP